MKKIFFSLVALVCSMSMNAQIMKVMKNGEVVATYTAEQADHVVFEEESGYTFCLENTDLVINQAMIDDVADKAKQAAGNNENYSATIVIPAGATIDIANDGANLLIPEGMSVTFLGVGVNQPVVKLSKSINIGGQHSYIRFENLSITEAGCSYVINQSEAANVDELSFTNCHIYGIANGSVLRVQGGNLIAIGTVNVDGCEINNMPDKYYAFDLRGGNQNVGTFNMNNSTVWNTARFFQNTGNDMAGGVNVTNTTFNDIIASGRYLIDCNGKNTPLTLKNVIIGTLKAGARGCRTASTITSDNVYQTSDILKPETESSSAAKFSSNDMKIAIQEKSAADIFADPANGDFTLKIDDKVGDPRWYKPAN